MLLLSPDAWTQYELLDSGNQEKLERFGPRVLIRPEPQALWDKALPEAEWTRAAHARFVREKRDREQGGWQQLRPAEEPWTLPYQNGPLRLKFRLALTSFGHVGVFPEQAPNWDHLHHHLSRWPEPAPKVLNLFAYTGGATLAARAAGADVTHLDSVRAVVNWASDNARLSQLDGIRWIVEDALKFAHRELRRGSVYQAIVLDPPAYGRGANGEKWVLEDSLNELLGICAKLLSPRRSFLVLNLYSMGLSALLADTLARAHFPTARTEFGEFFLNSQTGQRLPLGIFLRAHLGNV